MDAASIAIAEPSKATGRAARGWLAGWLWSILLLVLAFLVLYPIAMLLGALTGANPVVEGIRPLDVQIEAVELGTSARHAVDGTLEIVLPPALCWARPTKTPISTRSKGANRA